MEIKADSCKGKQILNEIYETEKTYQHHLMLLKTLFIDVIKFSSLLPANFVDGIFSNAEAIQGVSLHLLKLMEEEGVIHALLQFAPYLKLYSLYANNFDTSNKLLVECIKKYPEFGRLVYLQENQEEMQSLKLTALLVTPIQRVPRYCLLLGNLLEKTGNNVEHDMVKLKDAYEKLKNVATHINECVRQHENFHKMLSIQNKFLGGDIPQIMVPGRMFIKEGNVTKVNSRGQAKERVVLLFSDILVLAKKEGNGKLSCCVTFELKNCIVEDVMGNNSEHGNGLFRIICDEKSILLCSKDDETSWILRIRNCVRELHTNLASLRRRSSESNIVRFQKDRPKSRKNALKALALAAPVQPSKLLRRQKTQSMEKRSTVIFQDEDVTSMDVKPHFYHHNDSYGCSLSLSTSTKSDDEVIRDTSNLKPQNPRRQNWSLTEPMSIEPRRPLRSIRVGAKQVTNKLGCKRKQDVDPVECWKKPKCVKKMDRENCCGDTNNNRHAMLETVRRSSTISNPEKGNGCVVM